jgi:hypothetical protein
MSNPAEHAVAFPVLGGIIGVGRLATRLKELLNIGQIGAWHIGEWVDSRDTEVRMTFRTAADGNVAKNA